MKKTSNKIQYHPSKIKPLAKIIARVLEENPGIINHPEEFEQVLADKIPNFHDATTCLNCGASLAEYVFEFDVLDALLLYGMGQTVMRNLDRMKEELDFTKANQVRPQDLIGVSHSVKCRTTQCSKLGLIAKLKGANGRQIPGYWVVTKRGWEALRGVPVPRSVRVFRGQILERTDEMITIADAFRSHSNKVEAMIRRNKNPKTDYRTYMSAYEPSLWVHVSGMHVGELI